MKKFISLALTLSIALTPSSILAAGANQTPQEKKLEGIINNAQSKLNANSVQELITAISNLSDGIVVFEKVKNIESLELQGELTKSKYYLGEKISLDGLKLMAKYNDGKYEELSLENIKESNIYLKAEDGKEIPYRKVEEAGTYTLVIELGGLYAYAEKGAAITLEEKDVTLESIKIKSMPKTEYIQGEELDTTGLVVEAIYSDNTKKEIDSNSLEIKDFDSNMIGEQTITITYNNKTLTYKVTVKEDKKPVAPEGIKIDRLFYAPNLAFNGEITVILNKPTTTKLELNNFSVHCPGLSEMTIMDVSTEDNKTYKLRTPAYKDNTYVLEIYFDKETLEGNFVVKSDCPIVSYPYVNRISDEEAIFKFSSDDAGSIAYMIRPTEINRQYLRANDNIPTESELTKTSNITAEPNEIKINGLSANTSYELYYMTISSKGSKSTIYGPVTIPSEVEEKSTSNIRIMNVKFEMVYGSQLTDTTQDIIITLSETTSESLTLNNFKVLCPAGSNLKFNDIKNNGNKVYRLKMMGVFYDNNYEITVNFPDGTFTKTSARCKLKAPQITGTIITRTSENDIKVVFQSDMDGYIYYGFSNEKSAKPPYNEVIASSPKQEIHAGQNTLRLNNIPNDCIKYFYWISENVAGSRIAFVDGAGDLNKVPIEITPEKPAEPESKIKIENIEVSNSYYNIELKVTLSEDYWGSNSDITFEGDNAKIESKYRDMQSEGKYIYIGFDRCPYSIPKGTYTISIKFDDGVAKKDIVLTKDLK